MDLPSSCPAQNPKLAGVTSGISFFIQRSVEGLNTFWQDASQIVGQSGEGRAIACSAFVAGLVIQPSLNFEGYRAAKKLLLLGHV